MRWEINRIFRPSIWPFRFEPSGSAPLPVFWLREGQDKRLKAAMPAGIAILGQVQPAAGIVRCVLQT